MELSRYPERTFAAGELVFDQGDVANDMYVLEEGVLAVVEDGVELVRVDEPGAFVGELSHLLGTTRGAALRAVTDVRVRVIEDVELFFSEDPGHAMELARLLARRLHDMDLKFLDLHRQATRAGLDLRREEHDLPPELAGFRGLLRSWRVRV